MSKINAIRLINLNYNYNGIRVDDETFHLNGESTLLSLRNGGGKSVLVQMLIAPFVHKRYRDSNKRKFSSYFTTNKPTFILVEWILDGNSGYVLTGMMVRKSQEISDDDQNDLEIMQFIHEYKDQNQYDIHNIPLIKVADDNRNLMRYSDCKKLLETIKLDKDFNLSLYDMNNSTQSRSYYNKLEEYQIYYKEWESIVKKINLKESGLSELFTNAKDESGLIETWFLPAVEDKLNKSSNRIDEFREILSSYIKQYKENKSKIDQKNIILLFKEETGSVLEIAEELKLSTLDKSNIENTISNLILKLRNLRDKLESERITLEEKEVILKDELERIQYESLSFEIYNLQDENLTLKGQLSEVTGFIDNKEEQNTILTKQKNVQQCAKINEDYRDASKEVQELENKLEIIKDKDKDRAPEREALGYTLRNHYENEREAIVHHINTLEKEIKEVENNEKALELELENLSEKQSKEISEISKIEAKISNYDKIELRFNKQFSENLRRNMLNEYEDGSLDIRMKNLSELIEQKSLDAIKLKKESLINEENIKINSRQIQDKGNENATIIQEIIGIKEKIQNLNSKIELRKTMIKHIGYDESRLFDTEAILKEFKIRIVDIEKVIESYQIHMSHLEDEYNKIKSGKVLELPEDVKEALELGGINYAYGMEWLRRNNNSIQKNNRIIKNNPFIPYSLILTSADIERLKTYDLGIYTSFPIPIIIRENLEREFEKIDSSIYLGDRVSFYLLFNESLLDEEELNKILFQKDAQIQEMKTLLDIKREDLEQYEQRYSKILYQDLSKKEYQDINNLLISKEKLQISLENQLNNLRKSEIDLKDNQERLRKEISKEENIINELERKAIDLKELNIEYKEYLGHRKERTLKQNEISKIKIDMENMKNEKSNLSQMLYKKKESRIEFKGKLNSTEESLNEYIGFEKREVIQKDIEDIEARYRALTSQLSGALKDIEELLQKANERFRKHENDLIKESKRLNVREEEYINEVYDSFVLESIENKTGKNLAEIKELNIELSDLKADIAVKENEISQRFDKLKENLNEDRLVARSEIVFIDFKKRTIEKSHDLKTIKTLISDLEARAIDYDSNLSTLAEYYELPLIMEIVFDEDIETMGREKLDRFRGTLLRDYRLNNDNINKLRNELSSSIDKLLRNKAFSDDFFYKPINTLYSLLDEPFEFIEQLQTTIRAYDDLMAKLEVDIAIIGKEKERIIQMLLEYIRDIHKNLDKIDKNSTIKIRERSVKMLRMDLPDWEAREIQYKDRLEEMIEDLTLSGINRLEGNENIEEIISPIITSKNLYNTVVGINNIGIKLYKIEAERQFQIDWAEVSKNSGGEGFLSAFVILSSLLSFMRRDDTDIFAELEESKVLIMDNPFAQTNASHLLNPLMGIAKKSNTQLISFTGLGGESIYNSFENIYVLNLVSSSLRKGMQYLKSHHAKGEDIEIMVTSQVRTEEVEQLNLF